MIDCKEKCPYGKEFKVEITFDCLDLDAAADCAACTEEQLQKAEAEIEHLRGEFIYAQTTPVILEKKPTGHWTDEPPTEPGHYKTITFFDGKTFVYIDGTVTGRQRCEQYKYFWSEKETFPPLPEDDDGK